MRERVAKWARMFYFVVAKCMEKREIVSRFCMCHVRDHTALVPKLHDFVAIQVHAANLRPAQSQIADLIRGFNT